jgi:hypothetical protein
VAEWIEARETIARIQNRHVSESGKVIQKLLALTLLRLGYDFCTERTVQGVDIDVVNKRTGERHSFEVKSSKSSVVPIVEKDVEGLKDREGDGYETFFAFLCLPICYCEGWLICPARKIKTGQHEAMSLLNKRNMELSEKVNALFPEIVEEIGIPLTACKPGRAMQWLKEEYGI